MKKKERWNRFFWNITGTTLFSAPIIHFFGDKYYILKEGDEIIAGVSAIPSVYKVYDMPGIWGWVMMSILPKMPYFRRLFRPGEFRYLVFDSIYCKPGKENLLANLFESAMCFRRIPYRTYMAR